MNRKLIGTCVALVALAAFAIVPAVSFAQRAVDTVGGVETTVAVGSKIVGYGEEESILKSSGLEVKCSENVLTGTVTQNAAGKGAIKGTIEDAWFQGKEAETKCSSNVGAARITLNTTNGTIEPKIHYCLQTIAEKDTWKLEPHNCGGEGGAFTFGVDTASLGNCGFTRTANIEGTFKTGADGTPATFTTEGEIAFSTSKITSHGLFCPASGTLSNLKFNLYTDASGVTSGTYSQAKDTENPVWITTE